MIRTSRLSLINIAIEEKQIQLGEEETAWLYATIDVDSKVVLHTGLLRISG